MEIAKRLIDAACGVHAKAFRTADAGKREGGEGGNDGDFSNAVHDGILSSAETVCCLAGDRLR
jgi:hypothetical protein